MPLSDTRPHPVAKANAVGGLLVTVIAIVVGLGIIPAATGDAINSAAIVGIPAAIALMAVVHTLISFFTAKKTTTPSSDPRASVVQSDGTVVAEPLVPASFTQVVHYSQDTGAAAHADQGATALPDAEDDDSAEDDNDQLSFDDPSTLSFADPSTSTALR